MSKANQSARPRWSAMGRVSGVLCLGLACGGGPPGDDVSEAEATTGATTTTTGAVETSESGRSSEDTAGMESSTGAAVDCEGPQLELESAAAQFAEAHALPGVVMGASTSQCSGLVAAAGMADLDARVPMTVEHRLAIGSVTKTYVAALMLLLQEEGLVDLEDPLADYVSMQDVPGADVITLRQLLSHQSGIDDFQNNPAFIEAAMADPGRVWQPMELVQYAVDLGPLFEPGQGWFYANTNYILVGLVAEQVTGSTLSAALRSRVLDPARLENTYFDGEEVVEGDVARGYYMGMDFTGYLHPSSAWASGAMVTTAGDLLSFTDTLLRGDLLDDTSKAQLVDWIETGGAPIEHYSLGLFLYDLDAGTIAGHNGGIVGYQAAIGYRFDTDDIAVVLFNTLDDTDPLEGVDAGLTALDQG